MSTDEQHFATQVLAGFRDAGRHTDAEVVAAGGPSTSFLTNLRKVAAGEGTMPAPRGDTLRRIDRATDWKPGSARELWLTGKLPEKWRSASVRMADILGLSADGMDHVPSEPRRYQRSLDGYLELLGDRVTDLQERVDLLEQHLYGANTEDELPALKAARKPPRPGSRAAKDDVSDLDG